MKAKILFLIVFFFLMSFSLAEVFVGPASDSYFNNVQETPSFSNYYSSQDLADFWPILKDMRDGRCEAATDFAVMIPPGGCTPSVVRSDLLAEQNVPVFCKLVSVQLNPLIRTSAIKSITFKGDYPKEVAGVRFHPNRAGTNVISNTLLNNPIANEVGYVVIILKKTPNESAQTKWISVNLTANLVYDAEGAFGLGKSDFYLESMSDEEWEIKALYNSFWLGKGYVRLLDVDKDKARIAIYLNDKNRPYREMTLKEGQTSEIMYLPGMYCLAGVKLRVNSISGVEDSALLKVNNDFSWVRAGTEILNGRCRVIDMVVDPMENGEIKLRCQGVKDDIRLSLKIALKANITINNTNKIHSVGNIVLEKIDNKNWYLVYTTEKSKIRIANERRAYAVLISERSEQEPSFEKIKILIDGIEKVEYLRDLNSYDDFIRELEKNSRLKNGSDFVVLFPEVEIRIKDTILKLNSVGTEFDKGKDSSLESNKQQIEEYYGKYETAVKNLARDFPNTKEPESNDVFAEKAYIEQIEILTKLVDLGLKTETELNQLKEEFLEKYPRSVYSSKLQIDLLTSKTYDRRNSSVVVNINGINNLISLQKFEVVSPNKKFAEVFVNNKKLGDLNENSIYTLVAKDGRSYGDYIVVDKISKNSIDIIYYENQTSNEKTEIKEIGKFTFGLESKKEIGSQRKYEFYLRRIDLPLSAHVSLIPEEKGARTEANFTFKIGIEKRMFEITPERANKSLERLNKTIKEWEKKLENLGNLVTGWKSACFFTGLGLNVKNLITGASGGAIARQEVMKAYREFCENEVSSYEGKNKEIAMAECYNKYKSNINQDIEAYKRAIQDVQNEIKGLSLDEWKKRNVNKQFTIGDTKINANDFSSWAEVKNYLIYEAYIKNGGNLDSVTGQNLKLNHESDLEKLRRNSEERQKEEEARQKIKQIFGVEGITPIVLGEDRVKTFARTGIQQMMVPNLPSELNNMQYEAIVFNGVEYLVGLTYISPTRYQINSEAVLKKDGSGNWEKVDLTKEKNKQLREELSRITIIDGEKCEFPYKEMPVVRYYNQRIAKGLPAIVPFDNESGWYVKVSAAQGSLVSKEVKGYYDSGDVNFFFVCNVGPNGKEEDKGGDDICQSFDINNYDKVERFNGCSGLTQTEIKQLGDDARQAIRQVASQYNDVISKKLSSIYIKVGSRRGFNAKVGLDYDSESPIAECYDFMSVDDCNILFNVCDPIICPASRCDFGGKMPVDNVIASGIAGSLFLCLPNFGSPTKGKVLVPICLTGVHAGLDAYLSILRAQYQCMDEAMKTGKYVGVCDYITAIYKCEFFWRNAQPMLKNFVPMALEFLNDPTSLGRSKGGGEYLTFQRAWDNMEQSLDFFKNKYSGTSFRNLQFSNTQEIGSEICRRFIGTSMPTKANFKEVFAPDSPTQFYAEFSEIPFTEATSPPTSQYKVLYHIYAGNDQSVSYRVYLKDPPASPQYQGHATIYVASGIIGKGKFASESKDFTGPQGYKQLCVELNGVEKCGFKQVTSDVGIEYLKKIQVKKEAERTDIVTEKECVYGGSSILGLTSSLNVEEDAQASLTPEISKRGLIRICASEDPGKSVEPGRWVQVGYCGNPNIKCWLDTKSINQETVGLVQAAGTIKKAESILKQEEEGELNLRQNEANVNARLNEIAANISKLTNVDGEISQIEKSLNEIRNALDYQMARVSYLRAKLYEQAVIILTNMKKLELAVEVSPKTPATTNGATVSKTEENDDSNKNLASLNLNNEIIYRGKKYVVYQKNDEAIGFVLLKADGERDPSNIKKCSLAQKKTVKDCFG